MACAFSVLAYRFYRDPERTAPTAEGLIMSPPMARWSTSATPGVGSSLP
jgi:hypothetical protein